jgi:hypothetical protein
LTAKTPTEDTKVYVFATSTQDTSKVSAGYEVTVKVPSAVADITCYFTGKANSNLAVFTITGSYADNKGSAVVNDTTYTDCLKIESSTDISFTTTEAMTLTLYFASGETGKKVKIDGTDYTTDANAKVGVSGLATGAHHITKGDSINLFFIELKKQEAAEGMVKD